MFRGGAHDRDRQLRHHDLLHGPGLAARHLQLHGAGSATRPSTLSDAEQHGDRRRCPTSTKPTPPGNLGATASARQVALSWQASTGRRRRQRLPRLPRKHRGSRRSAAPRPLVHRHARWRPAPTATRCVPSDAATNESDAQQHRHRDRARHHEAQRHRATCTATGGLTQVDLALAGVQRRRRRDRLPRLSAQATQHRDRPLRHLVHGHTRCRAPTATRCAQWMRPATCPIASNAATATVPDTEKPTCTGQPDAPTPPTPARSTSTWEASSDNVGGHGLRHLPRRPAVRERRSHHHHLLGRRAGAGHPHLRGARLDAAGNQSDPSNSVTESVVPPDDEKPAQPGNLTAALVGTTGVDLAWDASTTTWA